MVNAPDDIAGLRRDLARAFSVITERAPDYKLAREYYDGTRAEVMLGASRTAQAIIEQMKAAPLSFAHIPVDVVVDKVELASITSTQPAAKSALETWMDSNDIDDEAGDWILKACYFGDYYVLSEAKEEEGDGRVPVDAIDTVGLSPLSTVVVYDAKTGREALFGAHAWNAGGKTDPRTHVFLYYDNTSVKLVAEGHDHTDVDDFDLDYDPLKDEEPEDAYIDHEGGRMLISHLAVGGKPYGVPLHRKAYGPQDAITKISANNLVNVESQGLPSRWALLDPATEIDDDIDDDFGSDGDATPASPDGRRNATTGTRTRTVPGAIEYLRGVKQTGTYEPAQTDPFLANLEFYIRAMGVACGVALFELDLNGEQPSGESRRRAEGRSNRKASKVKRQAEAFLRDVADTVLALAGIKAPVAVTFNPSETSTDKDGLELVGLKIKNGVPVRDALLEAGYTDEKVNEWYPLGAPALSPDLVTVLATALAALGNAKTLGAISAEGIEAMIPELFDYVKTEAAEGPIVDDEEEIVADPATQAIVVDPGSQVKAQAEALGLLVRAGADPEEAAAKVGLEGISFPNVPVTVRIPEAEAVELEGSGAPAPTAA